MLGQSRAGVGLAGAADRAGLAAAGVWTLTTDRPGRPAPADYGQHGVAWSEVGAAGADLLILAVRDDAIADLARRLAEQPEGLRAEGTLVLHLSGSLDRSVLAPLAEVGVSTAALHPMRAFPFHDAGLDLSGTWFALERGGEGSARIAAFVAALGGHLIEIDGDRKAAHHLACVMASNALSVVLDAVDCLRTEAGAGDHTRVAYASLAAQAVQSWSDWGKTALTGPWVRGDLGTVSRHLRLLDDRPELQQLYRALARSALADRPDSAAARALRAALADET